jgi:uncharacterized protein YgiB involved in biofilm formation
MSHRKAVDDCEEEASYSAEAVRAYALAEVEKAVKAERERCAKVCESEAEKMREQASLNPEDSPARDRFVSRWRALASIATEIKLGPAE